MRNGIKTSNFLFLVAHSPSICGTHGPMAPDIQSFHTRHRRHYGPPVLRLVGCSGAYLHVVSAAARHGRRRGRTPLVPFVEESTTATNFVHSSQYWPVGFLQACKATGSWCAHPLAIDAVILGHASILGDANCQLLHKRFRYTCILCVHDSSHPDNCDWSLRAFCGQHRCSGPYPPFQPRATHVESLASHCCKLLSIMRHHVVH